MSTTRKDSTVTAFDGDVTFPSTFVEHRARLQRFTTDGGRIAYLDEGPREGRPILLLHGMPTSSWLYRKIVVRLTAGGLRVIAPDMLGFGASDKPVDANLYTLDRQVGRIIALMQHLGIVRWTQVVHDLGGPWTWELADRYPQVLNGLVITNTTAYLEGFTPPAMVRMVGGPLGPMMTRMMGTRLMGPQLVGSFFRQFVTHPERLNAPVIEAYWKPLQEGTRHPFLAFARSFPAMVQRFDCYPSILRQLNIPAMTIWGKQDPVLNWQRIPAQFARDLKIPPERMHAFDDASHFLQEDQPEQIACLILNFMDDQQSKS